MKPPARSTPFDALRGGVAGAALAIVALGEIADRASLERRIERTIAEHDILRLKGFAAVAGEKSRLLIQAVGPRLNAYFDRPWATGERRTTNLVVIGEKHMDRAAIEAVVLTWAKGCREQRQGVIPA